MGTSAEETKNLVAVHILIISLTTFKTEFNRCLLVVLNFALSVTLTRQT